MPWKILLPFASVTRCFRFRMIIFASGKSGRLVKCLVGLIDEIRPQEMEHVAEMIVVARMRRRGQEDRVLGLLLLTQVLGEVVRLNARLREVVRFVEDDEIPRVGVQGRLLVPRDLQRVDRRDHLVECLESVDVVALEPFKQRPKRSSSSTCH